MQGLNTVGNDERERERIETDRQTELRDLRDAEKAEDKNGN